MSEQTPIHETQLTGEQLLEAGRPLLEHFGVQADPVEQPQAFREALQQIDPRYQGETPLLRFQLEAAQTTWDAQTKGLIMSTAERMRMLEAETPLQGDFDVVIVLGGARQSNLDRTRYAVDAIKEGRATTKHLIVAGSSRPLPEVEQQNTANYAPGAETEFDLCVGAAATAARENPGLAASVQYVDDQKAGTPAVIESVLKTLQENGGLPEGARIAAVTTQIYQASTERDLARVAQEFGASETFTAGNPSDPNVVAKRTPSTYLSEVLRTLRAAVNDVEAQRSTTPEQVLERVARIRAALGQTSTDHTRLRRMLKDIDRKNPQLSRTYTTADGTEMVEEPSGAVWPRTGGGGIVYDGPDDMVGHHPD